MIYTLIILLGLAIFGLFVLAGELTKAVKARDRYKQERDTAREELGRRTAFADTRERRARQTPDDAA